MAPTEHPRRVTEFNLLREFRRRAHNYLSAQQIPVSDGEWLALMQHFGAPTRLLDFTRSPYVAAYFAFENEQVDGCEECAIWAVDSRWCSWQIGWIALTDGVFGQSADSYRHGVAAAKGVPAEVGPSIDAFDDRIVAGSLVSLQLEHHAVSPLRPLVSLLEPERLTERMSIQQGVFLWPGDVDQSFEANFTAAGPLDKAVRQIVVPRSERGRAIEQLRLMNITRASLFPGLDGFANSFRQLLVREPLDNRLRRLNDQQPKRKED